MFKTYHNRLLAYMVLLLLFLVGVLLVNYHISRTAIMEQANENLVRLTKQVSGNVVLESRTLDQHVHMIRNNVELMEYMFIVVTVGTSAEPLEQFFGRKFGWLPVSHTLIISRHGKVLFGGKDKGFTRLMLKRISTDKPSDQRFFLFYNNIIHMLSVAPVFYQDEFLGNIIMVRGLNREWMSRVSSENDGDLFLVKDDKIVWTTAQMNPYGEAFNVSGKSVSVNGNTYFVRQIDLDAYHEGPTIWFGQTEDTLTSALVKNGYLLLIAVVSGSSGILVTGFLLLRNFRKPLRNLLDQMHQVESGKFPRIKRVSDSDEISQLTNRFAGMVKSLKEQQHEIEHINEQLAEQASTDVLTGLFNRRHLYDLFPKLLSEARRNNQQLVVMLADLDNFKKINDTYGHPFGDECLSHFSEIMKECCRSNDFMFRMGGEEFLILSIGTFDGGMVLAEKIRSQLSKSPIMHKKKKVKISVSIGVGVAPEASGPGILNDVLAVVDEALYQAKERGRNRVAAVQ